MYETLGPCLRIII